MATTLAAGGTSSATLKLGAFASVAVTADAAAQGTVTFTSAAPNLFSNKVFKVQNKTYGPFPVPGTLALAITDGSMTYTITGATGGLAYGATGNITGLTGATSASATDYWLFGASAQGAGKEKYNFSRLDTNASAVSRPTTMYVESATNIAASGTVDFHNIDALCYGGGSNANYTANVGLYCIEGASQFTGTASQTLGKLVGVYGLGKSNSTNGTLTVGAGVQAMVQNTGAGTITSGANFYAKTSTNSGGGTFTTAYGYYAEDVTAGTTNYSIFTNAGQVRFFGGTATAAGGTANVGMTMGSAGVGVFWGSGAPSLSAAQGSIYLRTDGGANTRVYSNTDGGTTWQGLTSS